MPATELRAAASLAGIFGLRMLGLFLILPVFAAHAPRLAGGENATLVGLALGAYGLTQALLQLPFGVASDRYGRRPVIALGLVLFAAGSFLAALAEHILVAIAGRALQGAGAIASVVVALAADLTPEGRRTAVMAAIGSTIGLAFALSLVAAPPLYRAIGMEGIFATTGLLALAAIAVLYAFVPEPPRQVRAAPRALRSAALLEPEFLRVNAGIFVLHTAQMAMFVVLPGLLVAAGLELFDHWKLYLPALAVSFALLVPAVVAADRRGRTKAVLVGAVALLAAVEAGLALAGARLAALAVLLTLFFTAFNVLEALLPALATRLAPAAVRGAAIGVFNTVQTLGLFAGGLLGGWVAHRSGPSAVFWTGAALAAAWLVVAAGMRRPAPVNAGAPVALGESENRAEASWHR